jgi:hypothetical protein
MLIIEIALGIVLAIFLIANIKNFLSLGLWAIIAIVGLGVVTVLISSLPNILNGVVQLFVELPTVLMLICGIVGVVFTLAVLGALAAVIVKRIFFVDIPMSVSFRDLLSASEINYRVLLKVGFRFLAERAACGLFYVFYPLLAGLILLVILTENFDIQLNSLVVLVAIGVFVLVVAATFAWRKSDK